MGLTFSSLTSEIRDNPHVWIQHPTMSSLLVPAVQLDPKPQTLNNIDTPLWDNFSFRINEYVSKLNLFGRAVVFFCYILVIACLSIVALDRIVFDDFGPVLLPSFIISAVVLYFSAYYCFLNKNSKLDEKINETCEEFNQRFQVKGFSIKYRTEFTSFCKPKRARPARVIIFPPVPNFEESQQDLNNSHDDLIDRDAWGL